MRAKEYLNQIHKLRWQIDALESQIEYLRTKASGVKAITYDDDKVQTSPQNAFETSMVELAEVTNRYTERILEYIDLTIRIEEQIAGLEKPEHSRILTLRYIDVDKDGRKLSLEKIARTCGYSFDRTKHLHKEALGEFEKKYLRKRKSTLFST